MLINQTMNIQGKETTVSIDENLVIKELNTLARLPADPIAMLKRLSEESKQHDNSPV